MSIDGQGTLWRRKIGENFNRLSRVHQRYRQTTDDSQTDGPSMTYSEHELEFTFAKKQRGQSPFINRLKIGHSCSTQSTVWRGQTNMRFLWRSLDTEAYFWIVRTYSWHSAEDGISLFLLWNTFLKALAIKTWLVFIKDAPFTINCSIRYSCFSWL